MSCPGEGLGLHAVLQTSNPKQGLAFAAGEAPEITIRFLDRCERVIPVASLGTANLYLNGPRAPLANKTASKLLNCVVDRAAADRQHHMVNLLSPRYADAAQKNLRVAEDGSLRYQLAPISDERPGTYTIGVWAKSKDELEQIFPLFDFQIGTETPEIYSSGLSNASSCVDCHRGPASGKLYLHHIAPGFSPLGNFSLDAAPIGTCRSCHNQDGYSVNSTLRKVHAVHRGEHQITPGVAHPEYGLGADSTLALYTNVGFPSMPDAEKDCVACHKDDRWRTAPSRQGCGTCHETVFFDKGTLEPPRRLARACTADSDCVSLTQLSTCDLAQKTCVVATHPKASDDAQCATCHSADSSGIVPIAQSHEILTRTRGRKIKLADVAISGGSGPGGTVREGDTLTLKFRLLTGADELVSDLKTASALSATLLLGGPTDDRQMIFPSLALKTAGTLSYDSGTYSYVLPSAFPARSLPPLNNPMGPTRANGPGTYSAWLYVVETLTVNGAQVRDVASALVDFRYADDKLPLRPRQVITNGSCNGCHTVAQAHGGTRRVAEGCSICHSAGAVDRTIGALGAACTGDAGCRSWEACRDTNNDMKVDTCVITQDPTPDQTIHFSSMIHSIHYARRLGGYAERSNLIAPRALVYIGNRNSIADLSEILSPLDVRDCAKCHGDSGAKCSAQAPCGVGQQCVAGACKNVSFQQPGTSACLGCHDTAAAAGHAALNTWRDPSGQPVETCAVCHGPGGDFAVSKAHNITSPYKPPYSREKE